MAEREDGKATRIPEKKMASGTKAAAKPTQKDAAASSARGGSNPRTEANATMATPREADDWRQENSGEQGRWAIHNEGVHQQKYDMKECNQYQDR